MLRTLSTGIGRVLARRRPGVRTWRPQWLPSSIILQSEAAVHPHDPIERADLFLAFNAGTTEIEVLNWLHATILLLKPECILETGAADGVGTLALASACKANGFGVVHSVELDQRVCARAQERIDQAGLTHWVRYHCMDAQTFLLNTAVSFDVAFFDSCCERRAQECGICMERGILRGPAIFHDTSPFRTRTMQDWPREPLHAEFRSALMHLATRHFGGNICESTLSRGLTVLVPKCDPAEPR